MTPLYHRGGPAPCLNVALHVHALPSRYEMSADNVVKVDGTKPTRGEGMLCGSCGQPITSQWLYSTPEPAAFRGLAVSESGGVLTLSF